MNHAMNRRQFLHVLGAASFSLAAFGLNGMAYSLPGASVNQKKLVVIFLRGGADGLSIVVPHGDPDYYKARPNIAIARPGRTHGAIDLDGYFGLHPSLSALKPFWDSGNLAFVHAAGSMQRTRSHFDAQDYMESGTPGIKNTSDGWMNRLMGIIPDNGSPTRALNFGSTTPRIFKGSASVANVPVGKRGKNRNALDHEFVASAFELMYGGTDPMSAAYQDGLAARQSIQENLSSDMPSREAVRASRGAPSPKNFFNSGQTIAQLLKKDPTIQTMFIALGNWDTHVNQGNGQGKLANLLKPVGNGLADLYRGLGNLGEDTTVVVMSEFGRTLRENGNRGTDHGHGNVMWIMGGAVNGGKVYGNWKGLSRNVLFEGRDVPVTVDFRNVLSTVLMKHQGLSRAQLAHVFPGFQYNPYQIGQLV